MSTNNDVNEGVTNAAFENDEAVPLPENTETEYDNTEMIENTENGGQPVAETTASGTDTNTIETGGNVGSSTPNAPDVNSAVPNVSPEATNNTETTEPAVDTEEMLNSLDVELTSDTTTTDEATVSDLSDWKDRTQVASTSTLSIVQVALLKDVLDGGSDVYTYYIAALGLVALCIILEIASAFILVAIYMLKSNLNKATMMRNNMQQKSPVATAALDTDHVITADEITAIIQGDGPTSKCLPPLCSTDFEQKLAEAYKVCYMEELSSSLRLARCLAKMNVLNDHEALSESVTDTADESVPSSSKAYQDCTSYLKTLAALRTARRREQILLDSMFRLRKNGIYKHLLRMQSVLTYIFLTLTFLNIFIVVFAIPKGASVDLNQTIANFSR